ncbi:cytochrome c nitrite reductase small subunit [Pelobacter propionicus]|uniref:Respiratory nitrite reductase specific menaquinol--cytochrome-c reductase (NrfH) n=1 Tax=Pelobacter propionicus (strain DSM 2379 / NBRC 103807 / OttBd1) TaxID=338966 RepID=A1ANA0_PELPD|nr:respiratory nitrite reductase specific menaquinol--cytochrome-c reductase (NrfH) precursor [Pelobacter propionicus DSM 2379]
MLNRLNKKRAMMLGLAGVATLLAAAFLLLGPPGLLAKSESPDFCASCHVMESQYTAFLRSGAHRRFRCVDCHLPNENLASHYIWKSIDGMKDVIFFYSGHIPERIRLSRHGTKVLQANCIRCHVELVSPINTERHCWSCHRGITHLRSGARVTR